MCQGKGEVIDKPCNCCMGSGKTEKQESLTVKIPEGTEEGTRLQIPEHGMTAEGVPSDDLYIVIESYPNPGFQRHGTDLWCVQILTIPDLVSGTEIAVLTINGNTQVKVPTGTQVNNVLCIRNKGLPYPRSNEYGSLNIRLQVEIPEHLTPEQKSLYEKLRQI